MATEKQYALANMLFEKTSKGELPWEPTFLAANIFQVSVKRYIIRISPDTNPASEAHYWLSLIDGSGQALEVFSDEDLIRGQTGLKQPYQEKMRTLYEQAKRKALNVDKAFDDVLDALKKNEFDDDEIPF